MTFIHLHGHSQYSLLEGIGELSKIIKKAKALEMPAIAITDYYALYGALEFYLKAKKESITAIIGVELPLVSDINHKTGPYEHLGFVTLLCNNADGYRALLQLVSQASTTGYYHRPRLDLNLLQQYNADLTVLIGGEQGVLYHNIQQGNVERGLTLIQSIRDVMDGRIVVEYMVQPYNAITHAATHNQHILKLGDQGYTLVCGNNYHYINPEEKEPFEVALSIKDGTQFHQSQRRKVLGKYHIMSESEIRFLMKEHGLDGDQIGAIIDSTYDVAETLKVKMPPMPAQFPSYTADQEITTLYESLKDTLIIPG